MVHLHHSTMGVMLKVLCFLSLLFVSSSAWIFNSFPTVAFRQGTSENVDLEDDYGAENRAQKKKAQTDYKGHWELASENSGVSAMHVILLPKSNKVLMYDATIWRVSKVQLPPEKRPCHVINKKTNEQDCWAHSVLFDVETSQLKALKLETDTWCSSGGLTVDGNLVSTGGFAGGANTVRYLDLCDNCDWREYPTALANGRWYSTQVTLPNGTFVVFGGRDSFTYEYIPQEGQSNKQATYLPFFRQTHDEFRGYLGNHRSFRLENNLYPFVHLSPDGNLFIFANNRSILLNPNTNKVVREFPVLPGGARNYPASGMSVLLPIKLHGGQKVINADVLICGGAKWDSFYYAETQKKFHPALHDCAKIKITKPGSVWKIEKMPSPRVMGDMIILPTGDVLMINGAKAGTSAWHDAEEPNMNPVLYKPKGPRNQRFKVLAATTIARMYHSTAALIPDGKVLVAGSNTHNGYVFNVKYPTELRVEKFSPPYLDPALAGLRQEIVFESSDKVLTYGQKFSVEVKSKEPALNAADVRVTMYAPAFTTHGISMNQRLLILGFTQVINNISPGIHNIQARAPPSGRIAPPGYYLLFVVYKGVPSVGIWVQIK